MRSTRRETKKGLNRFHYFSHIAIVALLMAGLLPSIESHAAPAKLIIAAQAQGLSLDAATAKVRKKTQGRVLSAEEQITNDRHVYRIKILMPNSQVKVFTVDVASGSVAEE